MSTKIPLNKIAELTAATTGEDVTTTLRFIKDLFSIVEDEVAKGNDVKIDGLGVFAKSTASNEPISFHPDIEYAARLNEAFSMFSPVELNEEVTEAQLEEATPDDNKKDVAEENESLQEPEITSPTEEGVKEEVSEEVMQEPTEIVELPSVPEIEEATTTTDSESTAEATAPLLEDPVVDDEQPAPVEPCEEIYIPEDEEVEYVVVHKTKSKFFIGFLLGLIVGFACGVIAFLLYIVRELNVQVEDVFPF